MSAFLLSGIGMVDAPGALTFSGRLAGMLFVLSGAAQVCAAAAVFDHWGKRTLRYSGAAVLLGVLITVATQGLLLALWLQEREWTPYLPVFLALTAWSLWAVWTVWRERAWKGIPVWMAPGTSFTTERVLRIPRNAAYDLVTANMSAYFIRGDRARIDPEFETPIFSWKEKSDRFFDCRPAACLDCVAHHARVHHNNNIINVTRRPRYLTAWRSVGPAGSQMQVLISPLDSRGLVSFDLESADRYGVDQYLSGLSEIPYASLWEVRP
ncbi:hypothetical protein AB0469_31480 [Streptomyces sp. NPDC093801]|uniref:hypothetical protein n=1 Tax=Streptomyces sp. NPDC093801 TaxID=3155203 RepID=UPI00344FC145